LQGALSYLAVKLFS